MTALNFADSHNMVAYLENSEANADFAEIVDFLNASPISYALTYLIHTILQYLSSKSTAWNEFGTNIASAVICLAKNQNFNFSKLIFDAVFNDEYDTPSHTKKVFTNMRRKGKDFSGTFTPLFLSMLASQAVEGEGSGQPTEPQHTPTTASPSHVKPIPTIALSSHSKKTQKRRKTKSKVTKIPQSNEPTKLDADEVVHEERGDSVKRAAITVASLDAEQDSGNINRTQSTAIPNVPFPQGISSGGVNTPGSDEERNELKELMDMCTKLYDRVLDLENVKDAQALEIKNLKKRVKKLERKNNAEKGVSAAKDKDSIADLDTTACEIVTTASVNLDDVTLAKTLMAIRSSASRSQKLKGVLFKEPSEPTTITTSRPQPQILAKDKGKDIMLQAEEREQMSVEEQARLLMEFIAARKKLFAAKRAKEQRNNHLPKQNKERKCVNDFVLMDTESSRKKVDSSGKKAESSKKRTRAVFGEESVKKHKVEDDAEKAELKSYLEILLNDDSAVNIESLATKYPVVD
ncbi:hypothetical protein Tco_0071142 [Tanacetum coccineum]